MYNPEIHHRQSIRLRDFYYSANGAYFVTICTQGRECLFGEICDGGMLLNEAGRVVAEWWLKLPDKFTGITLYESIIMPNHFHGILVVGAPSCGCPDANLTPKTGRPHGAAPTLGDVMDWFKTMTTNAYIRGVKKSRWPPFPGRLWQRNYYERIIRDEKELASISEYITLNPIRWAEDKENPHS